MLKGASADSIFLIAVRFMTIFLGMFVTRIMSDHFSVHDYGTYSQINLLVTTITSITILGMADGVNYYFCKEKDITKRDSYVSSIFSLQFILSLVCSIIVLSCSIPLAKYFGNDDVKPLMIYAAVLPLLTNLIHLLQVLYVAIGKAKGIALRNFVVALLRIVAITVACYVFDDIAVMLLCTVILDLLQVLYFVFGLKRGGFWVNPFKLNIHLVKEIFSYCIPMAMFVMLNTLNRDFDKYIISAFTDTETLAVYTNASKVLPFDIVMTAFVTVLLPYITRYISEKRYDDSQKLYKSFLEISYITTGIMAIGAIGVAPDLMTLLYSDKYSEGIYIFILYIVVDILRVLGITLVLSAAGKTKKIMYVSFITLALKAVTSLSFFFALGVIGPAISTVLVTFISGAILLHYSAREMNTGAMKLFDVKYLALFLIEAILMALAVFALRKYLVKTGMHYLLRLVICYGIYGVAMLLLNLKRLFASLKYINSCKMNKAEIGAQK